MTVIDLYEALGVSKDASVEDIQAAFKAKAKAAHPDAGGTIESFQLVAKAREVLIDPDKRAQYDATGSIDDRATNDRRDALNIVNTMMAQVIGQLGDGPIHQDIVGSMVRATEEAIVKIGNDVAGMRRGVVRLSDFAKRFKSNGRDNVLASMVQNKIDAVEKSIPSAERALELHKVALGILKDHSFTFDPKPPVQTVGNNGGFWQATQAGFNSFGQQTGFP